MSFQIAVEGSEIAFACEAGETVLDAAERGGYSLPYSCRKGICSTCDAELRHGNVDVSGKLMTGPASEVLLCKAKPRSDILICPKRISRHDPAARKNITANVFRVTRPADDVVTLMLRFPAGIRARFKAGQYLRVRTPDGDTRNFSMANAPRESDGVQLHIRRIPGGQFSETVLARLQKGDRLEVEIPFGEFYLRTGTEKPIVCLATGTGFAPIKSIIEDLIVRGNTRLVRLYWGGRRRGDLYLANLVDKWAARAPWLTFVPVLSEPDAEWRGATGLVHEAVLRDIPDMSGWQVYACGNPLMIRSAERDFSARGGLPGGQFFADPFVASGNPPSAENETRTRISAG
ncbi:MAG TPA: 2Fe-2S iron-sulfur cluster-binding protein [Bradyrhizobium sp.]|jgi:NAD(P)H-flavin reductase